MAKKPQLGRGLDALLGDAAFDYDREYSNDKVTLIPICQIAPNPYQPRKVFEKGALDELAESLKDHGLIQPIIVIRRDDGYLLVAGERRFRAAKQLGWDEIKAVIADIDEKNLRELALIENIQRQDLNPIELANSYQELIKEHNITQDELANIVKKSRTQITNTLRLLNLDERTKELISSGKISQGHAKILAGLDENDEKTLVDSVIGQKLSVRDTENLAKKLKDKSGVSNELQSAVKKLKERLCELGLEAKNSGKKLSINFENIDEVKNFLAKLRKV